jgi:hydrogenase nickel incorporation protein HypA/HybF
VYERALMENLVAAIEEQTRPARVARVELEIGQLSGVVPDALRRCFDACTRDTALEGADLQIEETTGLGQCRECERVIPLASFLDLCRCGSVSLEILAGQEVRIKQVEVH